MKRKARAKEDAGYLPEFLVKNIHYISFAPSEALG
jgi:hypothetical protein